MTGGVSDEIINELLKMIEYQNEVYAQIMNQLSKEIIKDLAREAIRRAYIRCSRKCRDRKEVIKCLKEWYRGFRERLLMSYEREKNLFKLIDEVISG